MHASGTDQAGDDVSASAYSLEAYQGLAWPEGVGLEGDDGAKDEIPLQPGGDLQGNQDLQWPDDKEGGDEAGSLLILPLEASLGVQQYTVWSDAPEEGAASAWIPLQPGAYPQDNQYELCPGYGKSGGEVGHLETLPLKTSPGIQQYIFGSGTQEEGVVSTVSASQLVPRPLHSLIHSSLMFSGLCPPIPPATGLSLQQGAGSHTSPVVGSPVVPDAVEDHSHVTSRLYYLPSPAGPGLHEQGQMVIAQHPTNTVIASPTVASESLPVLVHYQPPTSAAVASPSLVPQHSPLLVQEVYQHPANAVVTSPTFASRCLPTLVHYQPPTSAAVASPAVALQGTPILMNCPPATNAVVTLPTVAPQHSPRLMGFQPPANAVVTSRIVASRVSPMLVCNHLLPSVGHGLHHRSVTSVVYPSPVSGYYTVPSSAHSHSPASHPYRQVRNLASCYQPDQSSSRVSAPLLSLVPCASTDVPCQFWTPACVDQQSGTCVQQQVMIPCTPTDVSHQFGTPAHVDQQLGTSSHVQQQVVIPAQVPHQFGTPAHVDQQSGTSDCVQQQVVIPCMPTDVPNQFGTLAHVDQQLGTSNCVQQQVMIPAHVPQQLVTPAGVDQQFFTPVDVCLLLRTAVTHTVRSANPAEHEQGL